ncbi:hypothetical protein L1987_03345 [Smallanthus sonchifolius]|uniref:Uncharacterized protein n=1 Tax=Smallanthus sonchifolius TaxID=185202 RepID=A0ACB9KAG2_9ASTR|nr:hypothetical protein L1987_03345 [Smallanthus sonchifolius]
MSTGGGSIRQQLANLDLRMIIDYSLVEWKELEEEEPIGNEWEDRKVGRRKDFLLRRMELAKHFIRTNIEPKWMVLCLLPVLPPELRPIYHIDEDKLVTSDINEIYRRIIYRNNTLIDLLTTSIAAPEELIISQEKLLQEAVDALLDNGICGQPMRDDHNRIYKSLSDVIEGKEGRVRETLLGKRVDYSGRSVIVVGPSLSLHRCGLPREIAIELFQAFVIRDLIRKQELLRVKFEKKTIIWEILQEILDDHPVLLNRAPTLHRLGIQAFLPILVEGRAICLHPLVCKGFNANFERDQIAVHVPLSLEAQAEARLLMFSHMNLLSPTIGDPISAPTPYMLSGLYVLTSVNRRGYTSHILDQVRTLGFRQATAESISLGIDDLLTIPSKRWLVQDTEQQSFILEKTPSLWECTRGRKITSINRDMVHQLVGMRGLMSDPQGQMIDLPIQSNLREGLSLTEYIISCNGARKGIVDTTIRTSDVGYLTRRLVEVVQHIVVRRIDCGTIRGISVSPRNGMMVDMIFIQTLIGRALADDIYRNSILAYFDDPRYIRKSSGLTKYETRELNPIVNEEDLTEYRGVKETDHLQLRVVNYILYYDSILEIWDIGVRRRSIDSISMNLEKRIEGWNKCITRILGIPWAFFIGAELTIVQSRISLVNKVQKVYRSQGVQIHNRHIEIIVRQITSKVLVSENEMSNVFSPEELIGLLRAERMGRALEEATCYQAVLLGITRASMNTQNFISEARFQETARVLAKATLLGRIDWLKGLKENVVMGYDTCW